MVYEIQMVLPGQKFGGNIPPMYREVYFDTLEEAEAHKKELMSSGNLESDIIIVPHATMPVEPKKKKKAISIKLKSENALATYIPRTNNNRQRKEISLTELDEFFII